MMSMRSQSKPAPMRSQMDLQPAKMRTSNLAPIEDKDEDVMLKKYIEGPSEGFMKRNGAGKKAVMITDWDMYRKRNQLKKKDKIFICKEYVSFKKALVKRGWHENKDYNSPIFHLKFTVKSKDIYKNQKGTTQAMKDGSEFVL